MKLSERQTEIVQLLMEAQEYLTMKSIANQMSVSYKTIANDLNVLDELLQQKGIYLERTPNKGIRLTPTQNQMECLHEVLHTTTHREASTSIQERREQILLMYLWNSHTYYSLQKLSNQYYVSNTSIMKDIELIQEQLRAYDLTLEKSIKGTRLVGNEIAIRKALVDYMELFLYEHVSDGNRYERLEALLNGVMTKHTISFNEIMNFLESIMKDLETVSMKVINEPYYTNAFLYMAVMILRISLGFALNKREELVYPNDEIEEVDFEVTKQLAKKMEEQYGIRVNDAEAINVYRHLISGGLSKKEIAIVEQKTKENNRLSLTLAYTRYLIEQMSALSGVDFSNQVYLHSNLRFHVKPMLNRLRYDIKINNMMLSEIQKRYPIEFLCTSISCVLTSRRYELPEPSDAEIAYIMVYFQSAMERNLHDVHALIVSGNSMGSAQLLKIRLENTFQDLYIKDIIGPAKLQCVNMENIDVIFSTGEVRINLPYIGISPFLDETDIVTVRHTIKQLKKQSIVEERTQTYELIDAPVSKDGAFIELHLQKQCSIYLKPDTTCYLLREKKARSLSYELHYRDLKDITPCLQLLFHSALPIK